MRYGVKSEMGASVGVGGLIIGISMLVVFSMAYQAIALQIESGLDRIEDADQPTPSFSIDNAELWEGAVVAVAITSGGAGYSSGGTIEASTGSGGFAATYTINGTGAIISVVITSHGNYSSPPTLVVNGGGSPTSQATFSATLGQVVYANFTNTGSTTIHHDDMWLFLDGQNATKFASVYSSNINSENWFSGETIDFRWFNTGHTASERLALTVGSTTVGHLMG
jgi:archaellum component FlaF (FlaF/FlaG flagellin family)